MNLILLDSLCHKQILLKTDRRVQQIRKIMGSLSSGELFVGYANRGLGKASVKVLDGGDVSLTINWSEGIEPRGANEMGGSWLTLLIPYCRPQTCRKILREAASLGVGKLIFFNAEKSEKGYAESKLWKTDEWKELIRQGVEQAFDIDVPNVILESQGLREAIQNLSLQMANHGANTIALDNYESTVELQPVVEDAKPHILAIGPERGWSATERGLLKSAGYRMAHMGHRVMRTETAVTAACAVVSSASGRWRSGDSLTYLKENGF